MPSILSKPTSAERANTVYLLATDVEPDDFLAMRELAYGVFGERTVTVVVGESTHDTILAKLALLRTMQVEHHLPQSWTFVHGMPSDKEWRLSLDGIDVEKYTNDDDIEDRGLDAFRRFFGPGTSPDGLRRVYVSLKPERELYHLIRVLGERLPGLRQVRRYRYGSFNFKALKDMDFVKTLTKLFAEDAWVETFPFGGPAGNSLNLETAQELIEALATSTMPAIVKLREVILSWNLNMLRCDFQDDHDRLPDTHPAKASFKRLIGAVESLQQNPEEVGKLDLYGLWEAHVTAYNDDLSKDKTRFPYGVWSHSDIIRNIVRLPKLQMTRSDSLVASVVRAMEGGEESALVPDLLVPTYCSLAFDERCNTIPSPIGEDVEGEGVKAFVLLPRDGTTPEERFAAHNADIATFLGL
jgi:hypothetical protein